MIDVAVMASVQARRNRLEQVVRAEPTLRFAGIAPTFPFLRSLVNELPIQVVIIDLEFAADVENTQEWLAELTSAVAVVMLASTADPRIFNNFLGAEKGALLRSDASDEQIIQAIHSTSVGLLALDSALVPKPDESETISEELTPRETEVLRLLAEGDSNREIAERLDISEHTIKFHIRSILGKLGASTRTEAVTRGIRSGLIEL